MRTVDRDSRQAGRKKEQAGTVTATAERGPLKGKAGVDEEGLEECMEAGGGKTVGTGG